MQTFYYYCENTSCKFNAPFPEGSQLAAEFCRELGLDSDASLESCMFCPACDSLMLTKEINVSTKHLIQAPELYGSLIFCADLSASMHERYQNRPGTRYVAVVQSIASLLRELAGVGDGFAAAGRRPHYDHLLFSFVRFARGASLFRLEDATPTPYFSLERLARASNWSQDEQGYFKLQDIVNTVREVLLPKTPPLIDVHGTQLQPALAQVLEVARTLAADTPADGLPANFAGIGAIPKFTEKKRLYAVVYTDGQVHDVPATTREIARLDREVPELLRVTVFLGDSKQEGEEAGGGILRQIASPCFASHGESPRFGYFNQDQARDLRKVLRMVTIADLGICPECAQRTQ
jgi:hypothetical protein